MPVQHWRGALGVYLKIALRQVNFVEGSLLYPSCAYTETSTCYIQLGVDRCKGGRRKLFQMLFRERRREEEQGAGGAAGAGGGRRRKEEKEENDEDDGDEDDGGGSGCTCPAAHQ